MRRRIGMGLTVFLVVTLVLAGLAGWQWRVAEGRGTALASSLQQEAQSRTLAERNTAEAMRKEKDARHNLGFMFAEKAERALGDRRMNEARIYALRALANFDPQRPGPERATDVVLNNPVYPLVFSTILEMGVADLSPDGRTLASGSADNTIGLWDVVMGKEQAMLAGHQGGVMSVAFSPEGRTLASGAADKTIRLWDLAACRTFPVPSGIAAR